MNILYVCGENIDTPSCGCAQRSRFLCDALIRLGDVTVLSPRDVPRGSLLYRLFEVPFLKLTKVAHWPFRSHKTVVSQTGPLSDRHFDVVVCRYLTNASLVCAWKIAPCYVDVDDLPTQAFASVEGKRLPKWMRPFCWFLVKIWQGYCLRKCTGAWAVTPDQQQFINCYVKCGCLPNLARPPASGYDVNAPQGELLMTVGLMGYEPNYAGVDWFLSNVWMKVHERWPDLKYAIAGGGLPKMLKEKWKAIPGVEVLGFVDDIDALYAKSLAVVAPILSGAGTCIKVVEAGLHGRVVFATPMAARGQEALMALGGVKVFENANQFCSMFVELLNMRQADFQESLCARTLRINSFDAFASSVMEVIA